MSQTSRPQSGHDLDWLNPTTSSNLALDENMLFSSFKDTFADDSTTADELLFHDGLQLPLPGMESNDAPVPAPEMTTQEHSKFTNPQAFFSQGFDDAEMPALILPTTTEDSADANNKTDLPNLSINTDLAVPPMPMAKPPMASAQATPAWMNASTPFSALQTGKSTLQVLTPKSSVSAHHTRNPLQLGPGWTETVQMANLVAADGSGQYAFPCFLMRSRLIRLL